MRKTLPIFAEKNIFLFTISAHEILFPCIQVLVEELADSGILWHNSFFAALAIDNKVVVLNLIKLQAAITNLQGCIQQINCKGKRSL